MEGTYDVYFGAEAVGRVRVERQGLYYQFSCACVWQEGMYHLMANGEKLGLMVPSDGKLCLQTRLPAKRFEQRDVRFSLLPKHAKMTLSFIPLRPEEPFSYLRRLENAYLARRDGQIGVVLSGDTASKKL